MRILKRPQTIRFWLRWLVLIGVLPAWVATGLIIARSYQHERATLESGTTDTARALVAVVEQDLATATAALQVLATSPDLDTDNLAAFYEQARKALATQAGNGIVLADATGQQIMSTIKPYGAPLPRSGVPGLVRAVFASAKPAISDFYVGATSRRPQVAAGVPVMRQGKVRYVLMMGMLPERLGAILRNQHLPPDWIVSILDRKGTIIARTHSADQFVGQKGSPVLLRHLTEASEGVFATDTREGIPVLASFSRSPASGWTVAIGIPRAGLAEDLRRSLWVSAGWAGIAFLFALLLARHVSLRIARSLQALKEPALALAADAPILVPPAEIREVDEVGHALTTARRLLEEKTIARDQAERAERQMAVAKEVAEHANQAKSQFLTLMSHELRTPLNGILGFAQLIDGRFYGPLTEKQKEYVDAILASGNHLLELINDILDLSKIDAGRMTVSLEEVELIPVINATIASLTSLAEQAGVEIKGIFRAERPYVLADRVRLSQCLLNLGSNAIKYNRPGGSVTLSYSVRGKKVRLCVADTGIGIPQDRQSELFQPFNRLGAEHKGIEGTGVGLALTRRLVELMGGRVGFASTPGEGSRFWIDIPIYVPPAEEGDVAASAATPPQIRSCSILYVDDNPMVLLLMRDLLATQQGVRLLEATTGARGLAMAKAHHPDLILLDMNLPDMSGIEVQQQLKHLPEFAATPIIALSGNAMPHDIKRAKDSGFFDYITKPFDVKKFFKILESALSGGPNHQATDPRPAPATRNAGSTK
jgi:signal transduction histidine kinase/CheY-like chemotaxis protein